MARPAAITYARQGIGSTPSRRHRPTPRGPRGRFTRSAAWERPTRSPRPRDRQRQAGYSVVRRQSVSARALMVVFDTVYLVALTAWVGSVLFLSFGVAPLIFRVLEPGPAAR